MWLSKFPSPYNTVIFILFFSFLLSASFYFLRKYLENFPSFSLSLFHQIILKFYFKSCSISDSWFTFAMVWYHNIMMFGDLWSPYVDFRSYFRFSLSVQKPWYSSVIVILLFLHLSFPQTINQKFSFLYPQPLPTKFQWF